MKKNRISGGSEVAKFIHHEDVIMYSKDFDVTIKKKED